MKENLKSKKGVKPNDQEEISRLEQHIKELDQQLKDIDDETEKLLKDINDEIAELTKNMPSELVEAFKTGDIKKIIAVKEKLNTKNASLSETTPIVTEKYEKETKIEAEIETREEEIEQLLKKKSALSARILKLQELFNAEITKNEHHEKEIRSLMGEIGELVNKVKNIESRAMSDRIASDLGGTEQKNQLEKQNKTIIELQKETIDQAETILNLKEKFDAEMDAINKAYANDKVSLLESNSALQLELQNINNDTLKQKEGQKELSLEIEKLQKILENKLAKEEENGSKIKALTNKLRDKENEIEIKKAQAVNTETTNKVGRVAQKEQIEAKDTEIKEFKGLTAKLAGEIEKLTEQGKTDEEKINKLAEKIKEMQLNAMTSETLSGIKETRLESEIKILENTLKEVTRINNDNIAKMKEIGRRYMKIKSVKGLKKTINEERKIREDKLKVENSELKEYIEQKILTRKEREAIIRKGREKALGIIFNVRTEIPGQVEVLSALSPEEIEKRLKVDYRRAKEIHRQIKEINRKAKADLATLAAYGEKSTETEPEEIENKKETTAKTRKLTKEDKKKLKKGNPVLPEKEKHNNLTKVA